MKKIVLIVSFAFIFLGCKHDNNDGNCFQVACTEEFVTIVVTITDQNNNPVALDSFEVIVIETGMDITRQLSDTEFQSAQQNGMYPLFGDEWQNTFENQEIDVRFKGFLNGQEVANRDYSVGADCCHVDLISGDTTIMTD